MRVTKYTAQITTVHQAKNQVGFVTKGDSEERQALVVTTPIAFRWPQVGETWLVRQENGTWYLDSPLPTAAFATLPEGDVAINAPTGVIRVIGSPDGTGDYILGPPTPPPPTLTTPPSLPPIATSRGVATLPGSTTLASTVVSHGLPSAPVSVVATPEGILDAILTISIGNITATEFTIYGNGVDTTIDVFWQATL